jgi:hypothetical protein
MPAIAGIEAHESWRGVVTCHDLIVLQNLQVSDVIWDEYRFNRNPGACNSCESKELWVSLTLLTG